MNDRKKEDDWLNNYKNIQTAIDLDTGQLLIGQLLDFSKDHLLLINADLHDSRNANSCKEVYLSESFNLGINVNRKEVAIPRHRMVAIAKLEDTAL